jgi:hypothetical protein
MVELTAAGQILPQVLDRNDDDFHREGLNGGMGKKLDEMKTKDILTLISPSNLLSCGSPHENKAI